MKYLLVFVLGLSVLSCDGSSGGKSNLLEDGTWQLTTYITEGADDELDGDRYQIEVKSTETTAEVKLFRVDDVSEPDSCYEDEQITITISSSDGGENFQFDLNTNGSTDPDDGEITVFESEGNTFRLKFDASSATNFEDTTIAAEKIEGEIKKCPSREK